MEDLDRKISLQREAERMRDDANRRAATSRQALDPLISRRERLRAKLKAARNAVTQAKAERGTIAGSVAKRSRMVESHAESLRSCEGRLAAAMEAMGAGNEAEAAACGWAS